jgi:MFS family permease
MARGVAATTLRALRHRNFQLFFSGQIISLTGTWMDSVAQAWLVYRLTGSSVLLGLITFANQIPVFLISPIGGHIADRWNRHRIVIATQAASMVLALTLAGLTLTGRIRIWELFLLASLLGIVNAFDVPARQSFLVQMVGREDLMNAIALNSSMFNGARMVGPAIAGLLVAKIGEGWCFFANGISYIAVIVGLLLMKVGPVARKPHTLSALGNIVDGFRYVAHTGPIRSLLIMLGVLSLAGLPCTVLMPIFADRILHGGPRAFGLLMGCIGLGAMCGALLLASRTRTTGLQRWVWTASAGFSAMLAGFAYSHSLTLSCGLLLVAGFAMMIQVGSTNTLIQSMVPDHYRGRVMSVYSMVLIGISPLGAMAAGFAAARVGPSLTLLAGALFCLGSAVWFATADSFQSVGVNSSAMGRET